jgi:hypothetical protein
MKKKDLKLKQSISVPCPVCKITAGKKCQLFAGGLRFESHPDRQFAAIEAIEQKKSVRRVSGYAFGQPNNANSWLVNGKAAF